MRGLSKEKREIVDALVKQHDHMLATIIEMRLMQGMAVLAMARRLEKMASTMRDMSLQQELARKT